MEDLKKAITPKTRMIVSLFSMSQGCLWSNKCSFRYLTRRGHSSCTSWKPAIPDQFRRHNPTGKVFSRTELEAIGTLCVQHNIIALSDEVYDKLYYVPFTRMATLSPEIARLTLTVGSVGKIFYATGWRVGMPCKFLYLTYDNSTYHAPSWWLQVL